MEKMISEFASKYCGDKAMHDGIDRTRFHC